MDKRLSRRELETIGMMVQTRFDCGWWRLVNVRAVLRRLLGHIAALEAAQRDRKAGA